MTIALKRSNISSEENNQYLRGVGLSLDPLVSCPSCRFSVYDIDNLTPTLDDDDFLGMMECTLAEVVCGRRGGGEEGGDVKISALSV